MGGDRLLKTMADVCRDIVRDAVSGISVCLTYEDATLIGFMQTHQMLGLRRLMVPLAAEYNQTVMAESIFDSYLTQLENVKNGSRSLLQVTHGAETQNRPAPPAPL